MECPAGREWARRIHLNFGTISGKLEKSKAIQTQPVTNNERETNDQNSS